MTDPFDHCQQLIEEAVKRLSSRRRTFTEQEALSSVWEAGYEILIQSDSRFALAHEGDWRQDEHWRLSSQVLANNRLLGDLLSGAWDGKDLDGRLIFYDSEDQQHHVFCPLDTRLKLTTRGVLEPAEQERNVKLPRAMKAELDALGPHVLARWHEEDNEPRTLRAITQLLSESGWSEAQKNNAWLYVRAWLLSWPAVVRTGQDYWIAANQLPQDRGQTRLQVAPVRSSQSDEEVSKEGTQGTGVFAAEVPNKRSVRRATEENQVELSGTLTSTQVTWTVLRRTVNVIEGFIHVPARARAAYPPLSPGEKSKTVLRARWFEDDTHFWLWLDRSHHALYGEGLADRLAYLDTGTIVRIRWTPDSIVMQIAGYDEEVHNEETRLIDSEEIATLRAGIGESYRRSLQALLEHAPEGLTFPELVKALRERQGHEVHRGTIYAVLSHSGFRFRDHRWFAVPGHAEGARRLRQIVLASYLPEEEQEPFLSSPHPLPNRMKIKAIHTRLQEIASLLKGSGDS